MSKLSVVINTKNAAETIERAIHSVAFVDEVIVADMHSADETVAIAKSLGARIVEVPEFGRVEPEARNLANQAATHDWILQLDADEEVQASLAEKIQLLIKEKNENDVYYIARKNRIFGQWLQHSGWWPDYQPRLFRKGSLKWVGGVHSKPKITGKIEQLAATQSLAIIHHNYSTVSEYIERLNRYSSLAAGESLTEKSTKIKKTEIQDTYTNQFFNEFFRRYFAEKGWRDGSIGLLLAYLQGSSEVVRLAKTKELSGTLMEDKSSSPEAEFRSLARSFRYWLADYHVQSSRTMPIHWYWRIRRRLKW